jgi:O-acetyl-ADP-ribose deacetylase (regulator of RNase III)
MVTVIQKGDIFRSRMAVLINTVNCAGIMGKGLALEFKLRHAEMFRDYKKRCAKGQVRLGEPYIYRDLFGTAILNFPTKKHWRSKSKLSDIEAGLQFLTKHYRSLGIESLACPPLGAGNGGLEWNRVGPLIYSYLRELEIPCELYAPPIANSVECTDEFLGNSRPDTR